MAVLGDRYDYDVFFSYAWATDTGDTHLREWSRRVGEATMGLLRVRFNGSGKDFAYYLDRDQNSSAEDLDARLKRCVERSAVFVALVSPYYDSPYCAKEVEWFCDGVGLGGEALAERMCLLRIQHTPDDSWPPRLRGTNGKPLLYKDLCNENGQPRGLASFIVEGRLTGIADLIEEVALEIADKITALANRQQAQEQYLESQSPPDKPLFFFEAEPVDRERWVECGKSLREVPSIVLPAGAPKPATEICPEQDLEGCYGILMLRSRSSDDFSRRIRKAYLHRQKLFRERQEIVPWALLDDVDPPPPEEEAYDIPRVKLQGDWLKSLQQAFRC